MSIGTTLGALVAAEEALGRMAALKLPVKSAYHVAKLIRLVGAETQHFHQQRESYIRELGTAGEANGLGEQTISVTPANWPEFQRRIRELADIPVAIDWTPLGLADFDGQAVTAADVLALGPLLVSDGSSSPCEA